MSGNRCDVFPQTEQINRVLEKAQQPQHSFLGGTPIDSFPE
jgi:hypothetical protein